MDVDVHTSLKRRATDNIHSIFASTSSPSSKRSKANQESLEVYCDLLKSYSMLEWSGSAIFPRELAGHGWKSVSANKAQCISCHKFLSTDIPNILSVDVLTYAKCLKGVRKDLSGHHSQTCVYRSVLVDFHEFDSEPSYVIPSVVKKVSCFVLEPAFESGECELSDLVPQLRDFPVNSVLSACLNWSQYTRTICGGSQCVMFCDLCNRVTGLSAAFDPFSSHHKWCPALDKDSEGVFYWKRRMACLQTKPKLCSAEIPPSALGMIASKKLRMALSTLM